MYPFLRRYAVLGSLLLVLIVGLVGLRWCLAQPQMPTGAPPPTVEPMAVKNAPVKYPDQATVVLNTTGLSDAIGTISQPTKFEIHPHGQAVDRQQFRLEVCSAQPQAVTWGEKFGAKYRVPLPTTTGGDNTCELWGFRFHQSEGQWYIYASTPPYVAPRP